MIIGTRTNAANPTLIAKTILTSASSAVIFDRVFMGNFNHFQLVCVNMTSDDANTAINIQEIIVRKKASLTLILFFWCLNEKYKTKPMKNVVRLVKKNICQSELLYNMSIAIGINIANASMHNNIPMMLKADLKSLIFIMI